MPKVSEAHLEARRQQVLAAAVVCFSREGFHQTTMHHICREAGLSPGAVYRYFRSKDDIIEAIAREDRQRTAALIQAARSRQATPLVLDELVNAFFPLLALPEARLGMRTVLNLWAEAMRSPAILDLLRRSLDAVLAQFADIIREAQARGDVAPGLDPDATARVMVSLYQGLLVQKALDEGVDVDAYINAMRACVALPAAAPTAPQPHPAS